MGVAHLASDRYPLIVAANRDERHARPAAAAQWWDDAAGILAGRDLEAGGTWLGISRTGRFAAVTNIYEPQPAPAAGKTSRGELVSEFLRGSDTPEAYTSRLLREGSRYGAFKLLVRDGAAMRFASNRMTSTSLEPGVHAFTSDLPDQPSVRADTLLSAMEAVLDRRSVAEDLLDALTGESARGFANQEMDAVFVVGDTFGTRCATVLTVDANGFVSFLEQRFAPGGEAAGQADFTFEIDPGSSGRRPA